MSEGICYDSFSREATPGSRPRGLHQWSRSDSVRCGAGLAPTRPRDRAEHRAAKAGEAPKSKRRPWLGLAVLGACGASVLSR